MSASEGAAQVLSLPKRSALRGLPEETQAEVYGNAQVHLLCLLRPIVILRRKFQQRRQYTHERFGGRDMPVPSFMSKLREIPMFEDWPTEAIQRLQALATRISFEQRTVLCYAGTPAHGCNVFIVVNGHVNLRLPDTFSARATRQQREKNHKHFSSASSVCVLNAFNAIDRTDVPFTAVASTAVDAIYVTAEVFRKFVLGENSLIPKHAQNLARELAIEDRLRFFSQSLEGFANDSQLKGSLLFSTVRRSGLPSIARHFSPACPANGTVIFRKDELVHSVYFVEKGALVPREEWEENSDPLDIVAAHHRNRQHNLPMPPSMQYQYGSFRHQRNKQQLSRSESGRGKGEEHGDGEIAARDMQGNIIHQRYYGSATCLNGFYGEFHCYFGLRWPGPDLVADGALRAWTISKRELQKMRATEQQTAHLMLTSLRSQRNAQLHADPVVAERSAAMIARTPLFGQLLHNVPKEPIPELINMMTSRLYFPQEVLCSRSQSCEHMFWILTGRCRVMLEQSSIEIGPGTPAGYLMLIPHSWAHSVVAVTPTETLEITRPELIEWFSKKFPTPMKAFVRYSSIILRPTRYTAAEALEVSYLLGDTEPSTPLFSLDIPVSKGMKNDALFERRQLIRSEPVKSVVNIFNSEGGRPLSAAVQAGETTVFYNSPRRSGIRAHTNVFRKALEDAGLRESDSPLRHGVGIPRRPKTPVSGTPTMKKESSSDSLTARRRAQPSGAAQASKRKEGGERRLAFVEGEDQPVDAASLEKKVDNIHVQHKHRLDGLWVHSKKEVKENTTRLYPPLLRRTMSFSRANSLTSTRASLSMRSRTSSRSSTPKSLDIFANMGIPILSDDGVLHESIRDGGHNYPVPKSVESTHL